MVPSGGKVNKKVYNRPQTVGQRFFVVREVVHGAEGYLV
jgi:hypothetical protein